MNAKNTHNSYLVVRKDHISAFIGIYANISDYGHSLWPAVQRVLNSSLFTAGK